MVPACAQVKGPAESVSVHDNKGVGMESETNVSRRATREATWSQNRRATAWTHITEILTEGRPICAPETLTAEARSKCLISGSDG